MQLAQCWFPGLAIYRAKIYIFQIKYTEAILSNGTRKLLWFEISEMMIAALKSKFIVLFIIIFSTLWLPTGWNKKGPQTHDQARWDF